MNSNTAKIAFIGEPGSGKTTCIGALSEIPPVATDVACTDELAKLKETTTVALDYGELSLDGGGRLLLYGLPGQARFQFMFDVIREGLLGIIVLVDGASRRALEGLAETLDTYAGELRKHACVLAINKLEEASLEMRGNCLDLLRLHKITAPICVIDARRKADIVRVAGLLLTVREYSCGTTGEAPEA